MRILFITAFTPSEIGAAVKNTKITLERLSQKHTIDLVYCRYKHDAVYMAPNNNIIIKDVWQNTKWFKLINCLFTPFFYPQFSARYNWWYLLKIKSFVKKGNYDVIIFDHSQMFLYAKFLDKSIHKILFSHDVIAQRAQRAYNTVAYRWCVFSERICLKCSNSRIFTFSQKDCDLIQSLYGYESFVSSPYLEQNVIDSQPEMINEEYVMFGVWSRSDNLNGALWLIDKVVPLLKKKIHIKIIGKGFPLEKIDNLKSNVVIEYLGFVDNPYIIIANCKAVLAPIFTGAGLKFKVAESLACGAPVIGTDVALEGLPEECGDGMFLANNEKEFADYIDKIDKTLEQRIALKKCFLSCFDKGRVADYIDSIAESERL